MRLYTLPLDVLIRVAEAYGGSPISQEAVGAPVLDFAPKPLAGDDGTVVNDAYSDQVTARYGLFEFPFGMRADAIDVYVQAWTRNSYLWCAGYKEIGEEMLWNVRIDITGVGTWTFAPGAVDMGPGQYWIGFAAQTWAAPNPAFSISCYNTTACSTTVDNLAVGVYPMMGTAVVVAGALLDPFAPLTDLTGVHDIFPMCRFRQTS